MAIASISLYMRVVMGVRTEREISPTAGRSSLAAATTASGILVDQRLLKELMIKESVLEGSIKIASP